MTTNKPRFWLITALALPFAYFGLAVVVAIASMFVPLPEAIKALFGLLNFMPSTGANEMSILLMGFAVFLAWPVSVVLYALYASPWLKEHILNNMKNRTTKTWLWSYLPLALLGMWFALIRLHDWYSL